jgi:ribose transport system substrate-binding protein
MKFPVIFYRAVAVICVGLAFATDKGVAQLPKKPVFAVVPKSISNPFYDDVREGSTAMANELGVELRYIGPETADAVTQVKILEDLVREKVNGIAVAPMNAESVVPPISEARRGGIPVITFDSDSIQSDRMAYIGTNNKRAGQEAGKTFTRLLPRGKFAIVTGGYASQNLNERIAGFREYIQSKDYIEVPGSPFPCNDDSEKAVQIVGDVISLHPDLNGLFITGGWPMFLPDNYKKAVASRVQDLNSGTFVIVAFDILPTQLRLLKDGFCSALIGQRAHEMGAKSISMLNDILHGKKVANLETGVDVVERSNVGAFLK